MTQSTHISFRKTFRSLNLWGSAFVYHALTIWLLSYTPKSTSTLISDTIYDGPTRPEFIPTLPTLVEPISSPIELKFLINLLVFDILFMVIFYLYEKSRGKIFDLKAIFSIIILNNIYFLLLLKYLLFNLL